jgi:hypothetical protein
MQYTWYRQQDFVLLTLPGLPGLPDFLDFDFQDFVFRFSHSDSKTAKASI